MARGTTKDDAAELAALNAKLDALKATVERLKKDKTVREAVDALIRALRGHTQLEISHVLDEIHEDVFGTLADEDADDDSVATYRPMMLRRKMLLNRLAKKRGAT
jgi:P2-related tail formation protein